MYEEVDPERGASLFRNGLTNFLGKAYLAVPGAGIFGRALGAVSRLWGERAPDGRVSCEVHTKGEGLVVIRSVSYLDDWLAFGAPSPKVKGWLSPSIYYFGAKGTTETREYTPWEILQEHNVVTLVTV
jgi:hypothetical protein